jgi:uncharacterized membrane protein YgaE (UPF0421/DUF939 family)
MDLGGRKMKDWSMVLGVLVGGICAALLFYFVVIRFILLPVILMIIAAIKG